LIKHEIIFELNQEYLDYLKNRNIKYILQNLLNTENTFGIIILYNIRGIKMNELLIKDENKIKNMIHEVRGKQVILSSDVAKLYKSETKVINQVVKRNIDRFPDEFCFQLSLSEWLILRSQNVTSNEERNRIMHGGTRYLPYVFTEHGIMMLAGLLKSDIAARVNIQIINAFVEMRKYIANNNYEKRISNIETKLIDYDNNFKELFNKFETKTNHLFYEGQIYDAYSLMLDIINSSSEDIKIIDNYVDKKLLDILSKTNKTILIITNKYNNEDYEKYKEQYNNVNIKISNAFHDRFIINDDKVLYHCGASFKDIGKKCFGINKIQDKKILSDLLIKINLIK